LPKNARARGSFAGLVAFEGNSGLSGLYAALGITALGGSLEARLAEMLAGAR
jgi:hypothetical protein